MRKTLQLWLINAVCLAIADMIMDGISFSSYGALIVTALALMVLNAFIRPLLQVISFPVTVLTFGLFSLVINAAVLMMAFNLSSGSYIASFPTALIAAVVLAVVNSAVSELLK